MFAWVVVSNWWTSIKLGSPTEWLIQSNDSLRLRDFFSTRRSLAVWRVVGPAASDWAELSSSIWVGSTESFTVLSWWGEKSIWNVEVDSIRGSLVCSCSRPLHLQYQAHQSSMLCVKVNISLIYNAKHDQHSITHCYSAIIIIIVLEKKREIDKSDRQENGKVG